MKINFKLIGLATLTIGAGIFAGIKIRKYLKAEAEKKELQDAEKEKQQTTEDKQEKASATAASKWKDDKFPLAKYSSGNNVKTLQTYLGLKSDGLFGSDTETALKTKTGKTSVANQSELDKLKPVVAPLKPTIATPNPSTSNLPTWIIGQKYIISGDKYVTAYKNPYGKEISYNFKLNDKDIVLYLGKTIAGKPTFNYKSFLKGDLYFNLTSL